MEVVFERPGRKPYVEQLEAVPSAGDCVMLDKSVYDVDEVTWALSQDRVVVDLSP